MTDYTPIAEIPTILEDLRKTFRKGITKPLAWRRRQLLQLARFAQDNAEALAECLRLDLGRPKQEAMFAEIAPVIERCIICAEKLEEWCKPEEVPVAADWQQSWKPRVERHPKGVALLIAPWNYPIILSLQPLYGAISGGCCAVIKPSEIAPHYASFLAETLPKYLDQSAFRVVLGAVPEITKLLELKWDHIFYTGNGRVARIISSAAAKHLTPLTLELGGKSPVIVDATADVSIAAKRILWGKTNNAGQICVAPDYILAHSSIIPALENALKEHYKAFYPDGALASESYSRVVSDQHFARLKGVLGRTDGKIVMGGQWEEGGKRGFEPTVVTGVKANDALLEEEIFGPILPIVSVESIDEAIDHINAGDHPLILYAFSNNEENKKKIVANTTSGGVAFNDTFQQLAVNELPFGGVGESGYGRQVLKYSFQLFVYERGIIDVPYQAEPFMNIRYPPYTEQTYEVMSAGVHVKIPDDIPSS
ncbi:aldehyde dehydrogenase [Crassisporium funariophilum]|nr:aldehyde dehydrogenase [Crassisporium funariophilum]